MIIVLHHSLLFCVFVIQSHTSVTKVHLYLSDTDVVLLHYVLRMKRRCQQAVDWAARCSSLFFSSRLPVILSSQIWCCSKGPIKSWHCRVHEVFGLHVFEHERYGNKNNQICLHATFESRVTTTSVRGQIESSLQIEPWSFSSFSTRSSQLCPLAGFFSPSNALHFTNYWFC